MHEVSVAQNILDIISQEVKNNNATKVYIVNLVIGEFTCIAKDALLFALDIIKENTPAKSADFIIETVKLRTHCDYCNEYLTHIDDVKFICPSCKGSLNVVNGKELYIKSIDLE